MQALFPITAQQAAPIAEPTMVLTDRPTGESVVSAPCGFGQQILFSLPAAMVLFFVVSTVGIAAKTDSWLAAAGLGAYLAFWLGGGFGFLIAGIRWGLEQQSTDQLSPGGPEPFPAAKLEAPLA